MPIIVPEDVKVRFFSYTNDITINGIQHLLWTGAKSKGYGKFSWDSKQYGAHRFAWLIAYSKWPEYLCLHVNQCHIPACVLVTHLYDGTAKQNVEDCLALGLQATQQIGWRLKSIAWHRGSKRTPQTLQRMSLAQRGENHPSVKLTEGDVLYIRQLHEKGAVGRELAREFDVSAPTICNIVKRKTWSHI